MLKLALFILFITSLIFAFKGYSTFTYFAFILFTSFLVLTIYDKKFEAAYLKSVSLKKLCLGEIDCLNGSPSAFRSGIQYIDPKHDYSFDLDIFEEKSLFQHINRTASVEGEVKLKNKLLNLETNPENIIENTNAIKELSHNHSLRQNITILGMEKQARLSELINKSEDLQKSQIPKGLIYFSYVSVSLMMASLVLFFLKLAPSWIPFGIFIFQFTLSSVYLFKVNNVYGKLSNAAKASECYTQIASLVKTENFETLKLQSITQNLRNMEMEINKLKKILNMFDQRNNGLIYLIINGFFLKDIFSAHNTILWFRKNAAQIPSWLDSIGELDAISSLAGFAFNNPEFVYPEFDENNILHATNLCHPLIRREKRVGNDFQVKACGEFYLITGANMAGKSTFIRSVGINLVLACAGAPVCGEKFRFRPIHIFTSMRTSDKLLESASYFQAELARLELMKHKIEAQSITLVLLDEILKGTNSDDKLEGSRKILLSLVKMRGAGLLSTHDTALHILEQEFPKNFKNFSFDFGLTADGELLFDYKLKEGVSKNMNAKILIGKIFD